MKTIKTIILCSLLGLLPVFQSCSDDEDVEVNDLYGKWQMVREEGYTKEDGKIIEEYDNDVTNERSFIEFEKGGKFIAWEGNQSNEGTWHLNGSTLTIRYDDDNEIFYLKIERLTSTSLVTIFEEDYGDGDYEYEKTTFVKVI